ncbi:cilia- and flagella-associated protein 298-like [Styela clava]
MVRIHIKHGDESQFLYETAVAVDIEELLSKLIYIYNARLKIDRICQEMEFLAKHGTTLPPNMQGLTDDQIVDLKLKDEWVEKCIPSGGAVFCKDDIGRRNGQAPNTKMAEILTKTVKDAKASISKKLVEANTLMTNEIVKDALGQLRGAVMIVYPMGLPPHDPIQLELDNQEELSGTQASLQVIPEDKGTLWWAGKELLPGKKLQDYVGNNDKTKIVAKLQKKGTGPPGREPVVSEEQKKQMMLHAYRRQEELKKLDESEDNAHLNSEWADNNRLKSQFQGMQDIKWGPGRGFR